MAKPIPHINLQFVLGADLVSEAIAWFSAGHFSHVDVMMPSNGAYPTGWLLGARNDYAEGPRHVEIPPGVWMRPPGYAFWKRVCQVTLPVTDDQRLLFHGFLVHQIGKPYDHGAIWGFASGRDWRSPDSWMCSELVAAALEHACIVPKLVTPANKITPVTLATVVSAIGGVVICDSETPPD